MANLLDRIIYYLKDAVVKNSNGDITDVNNIVTNGYITLNNNNQAISFKDASDPAQIHPMVYINSSNNFGLGYGMYNSSKGETRIYGDTIRMYSHNPVVINQDVQAPRFIIPNDYGIRGTTNTSSGSATVPIIGINSNNSIWVGNTNYPFVIAGNNASLSTSGNLAIDGTMKIGGHSSVVGTYVSGTRESSAGTATTSYTTAAHIDLTAGSWLITGFNAFNGGTAGRRAILITGTSTAAWDAAEGSASGYAAASMHIALSTSLIVTPTGNATYYLRIKSASQVDSPEGNLAAVRIA